MNTKHHIRLKEGDNVFNIYANNRLCAGPLPIAPVEPSPPFLPLSLFFFLALLLSVCVTHYTRAPPRTHTYTPGFIYQKLK